MRLHIQVVTIKCNHILEIVNDTEQFTTEKKIIFFHDICVIFVALKAMVVFLYSIFFSLKFFERVKLYE